MPAEERRVEKRTNPRQVKKSTSGSEQKDLIRIRNKANREIYKFACLTCINGHRAPLCSPVKHRNKILFRRPTPGRPPKDCGHATHARCDCKSMRTLCVSLEPEQWRQLARGEIPEAYMYPSVEALEEAAKERELREQQARQEQLLTQNYRQNQLAFRPAHPGMFPHLMMPTNSMMPSGPIMPDIPHDNQSLMWSMMALPDQPAPNLASLPEYAPAPTNMYPQPQQDQTLSAPWDGFVDNSAVHSGQVDFGQMLDPFSYDPHMTYMANEQAEALPLRQPFLIHDPQMAVPANGTAELLPLSESLPVQEPQMYMQDLSQYPMNMEHQEQVAVQPSTNPTQSCCSKLQRQQSQQPLLNASPYNLPPTEPTKQFPCPSCASTDCQCLVCPEVRQLSSGAWGQSCGREGHLGSSMYPGFM